MRDDVPRTAAAAALLALAILLPGCAGRSADVGGERPEGEGPPPREEARELPPVDPGAGTPERAASHALVEEALERWRVGRADAAARRLEEAIRIDPTHGAAFFHLARLRAAGGRVEEARGLLERARDLLRPYPEWRPRTERLAREIDGAEGRTSTDRPSH